VPSSAGSARRLHDIRTIAAMTPTVRRIPTKTELTTTSDSSSVAGAQRIWTAVHGVGDAGRVDSQRA
jgi:hypothetical protein